MICNERPKATKKGAFYKEELKQMAEDKDLNKKHWEHKPYQCDFGGSKRTIDNEL